jgi:hypothetical protein
LALENQQAGIVWACGMSRRVMSQILVHGIVLKAAAMFTYLFLTCGSRDVPIKARLGETLGGVNVHRQSVLSLKMLFTRFSSRCVDSSQAWPVHGGCRIGAPAITTDDGKVL